MSGIEGIDDATDEALPEEETRLSTGIEILDNPEYLDGGFPAGSVITLIANPISTAELFLFDLASTRPTTYFTTSKSADAVKMSLDAMGREIEDFRVVDLFSAEDPADLALQALDKIGENENVIFDSFTDVIRYDGYEEVLNEAYRTSHNTGSVTYLYLVKEDEETMTYDESRVPYISDIVMKMITEIEGEKVENRLAISKMRGDTPPPKTVKLNIGKEIVVDTSRDIA